MAYNSANDCGFLYVCWGDRFVKEAVASASLLRSLTKRPIALITTSDANIRNGLFDHIIYQEFKSSYSDKIMMRLSPFAKTIFLDTDTHPFDSFDEIFLALDRFDLLYQATGGGFHYDLSEVPCSVLTEPSAGLVAWKRSEKIDQFFDLWEKHYAHQVQINGANGAWDQRSMRAAIWHSQVSVLSLPHEWQVCGWDTQTILGKVKMVHGRDRKTEYAKRTINSSNENRLYLGDLGTVFPLLNPTVYNYIILLLAIIRRIVRILARDVAQMLGLWKRPVNKRNM